MKSAREKGFYVRLNYVMVDDVAINLARVAARVRAGDHSIDEQTIRQRYKSSQKHLLLALACCDEAFIYDNSSEQPKIIFWLHQQKIMSLETELPLWCKTLQYELLAMGFTPIV